MYSSFMKADHNDTCNSILEMHHDNTKTLSLRKCIGQKVIYKQLQVPKYIVYAIITKNLQSRKYKRSIVYMQYTVEPPNKGHFGSRGFVLFSEVVLWWEVQANRLFIDLIYLDNMF